MVCEGIVPVRGNRHTPCLARRIVPAQRRQGTIYRVRSGEELHVEAAQQRPRQGAVKAPKGLKENEATNVP